VGNTYYEVKTTTQLSSTKEQEIQEDSSNLYSFKGKPDTGDKIDSRNNSRSSLTQGTSKKQKDSSD